MWDFDPIGLEGSQDFEQQCSVAEDFYVGWSFLWQRMLQEMQDTELLA